MFPKFKNLQLLEQALTHKSTLNEKNTKKTVSNERLEFLGDAVLELSATNFLYQKFPNAPEGELTAYRSALVKTTALAEVAKNLGIPEKIYMSKGEEATKGRENTSILADTVEAIIGALYIDQGYEKVDQFLQEVLFPSIDDIISKKLYKDAKSHLQELVQSMGLETPIYQVETEVGPDHDKEFTVSVKVNSKIVGRGMGKSKQQAQQSAAREAIKKYEPKTEKKK